MSDLFSGVVPFVYVAEEQSFRRAASRLGLTPAALSKAIQRLEEELGVALFHRTTRRVSLSAEGEVFLARCREAIAHIRAGRDLVAVSQQEVQGDLSVTLPFILGRYLVTRLPRFFARYPAIKVHLHLTDRFSRLVDENIDVAIRIGELEDSTLVARKLMQPRWVTVAAPSYLARAGTPARPEELSKHNCLKFRSPRGVKVELSFREEPETESAPGARGRRTKNRPKVRTSGNFDVDQGELLLEAARAGLGICQAFDYMVNEHIREGTLVEILADYSLPGPPVHALCLPGQQATPRVRAFFDFLGEIFGEAELKSPPQATDNPQRGPVDAA